MERQTTFKKQYAEHNSKETTKKHFFSGAAAHHHTFYNPTLRERKESIKDGQTCMFKIFTTRVMPVFLFLC